MHSPAILSSQNHFTLIWFYTQLSGTLLAISIFLMACTFRSRWWSEELVELSSFVDSEPLKYAPSMMSWPGWCIVPCRLVWTLGSAVATAIVWWWWCWCSGETIVSRTVVVSLNGLAEIGDGVFVVSVLRRRFLGRVASGPVYLSNWGRWEIRLVIGQSLLLLIIKLFSRLVHI